MTVPEPTSTVPSRGANQEIEAPLPPRQLRPKDYLVLGGWLLAVVGLVLPVGGALWSGEASWFGLPRSFVWVLSVLVWVFSLLVMHFRSDAVLDDAE